MQDNYSEITDLNYLALVIPEDGTVAAVADGCKTWAHAPDLEPATRSDGEHWLPLNYEGVHSSDGKLIDVVAWHEADPGFWWRRTGRGVVLGADELARVSWTDLPCFLVSSPAGWRYLQRSPRQLQSIVILEWETADTETLFAACFGSIICASPELERKLQARNAECGGSRLNTLVDDLG